MKGRDGGKCGKKRKCRRGILSTVVSTGGGEMRRQEFDDDDLEVREPQAPWSRP